jgi:hypothetical protein
MVNPARRRAQRTRRIRCAVETAENQPLNLTEIFCGCARISELLYDSKIGVALKNQPSWPDD